MVVRVALTSADNIVSRVLACAVECDDGGRGGL